jgi:hypothetical protein
VTAYDAETRSRSTDENKAAGWSLFELKDKAERNRSICTGPKAPEGREAQWIKTIPEKGWFAYFRVYGGRGRLRRHVEAG